MKCLRILCWTVACTLVGHATAAAPDATLTLHARTRSPFGTGSADYAVFEKVISCPAKKTAIVICDMWDRHWCRGATARVAEMAPRMNAVLEAARARGVLIIHAPSDTMKFYADYPQRQRAQQAPKAGSPPDVNRWKSLDRAKEPPLPVDDSDGGCDDVPVCAQGGPWRSQIATLAIEPEDAISDSGEEINNLLEQLGIDHVILMGVHTNMCVLGRSFGIRSLVGLGKQVLLMRDLTDTMYNSRHRPYVSHFVGTDLVIEHIEKYWCLTITSADFLGGEPFRFSNDRRKTVVFVQGENEYRTWETLPKFAQEELAWRGFKIAQVAASTNVNDYDFKGFLALRDADLVFVSARRRALPRPMLDLLQQHLQAGKPLAGLRTASHAFTVGENAGNRTPEGVECVGWPAFDGEVLGGNYHGHHPAGVVVKLAAVPGAEKDPVLSGVVWDDFTSTASLYRNAPLKPAARPLLMGTIAGRPAEPVAWTHTYGPKQARVFYISLGDAEDFKNASFRRLLLNGVLWAMDEPIPPAE